MFGAGAVARATGQEHPHVLRAGKVAVDVGPQDELSRALGAAMTDPAGRADHLVLHGIRVHSLRETKELLRANGTQIAAVGANRILGLATETMNVAMEFCLQDPIQHLVRATSPNGSFFDPWWHAFQLAGRSSQSER